MGMKWPAGGSVLGRVYARNGPNPRFEPVGNYHWFDGDGMTHAVRISSKGVSYSNRYVRTRRLAQEEKAGFPLFLKVPAGWRPSTGLLCCIIIVHDVTWLIRCKAFTMLVIIP